MAAKEEKFPTLQMKKYLDDNFSDLSQVYSAHKQSLSSCEEEITHWKKFIKDYNVLQEKLTTYPDKTSYEEVIPIGSLAYMKGRKIHTNEILVHLGENWFVERSVKDAIAIIVRRREICEEKLKSVERMKEIHEGWMKQTEELAKERDTIEILEQMSEEEYQKDKEKHKEMVAKSISLVSSGEVSHDDEDTVMTEMKNFEDLLRRLDLLEEQERMDDELVEEGSGDEEENEGRAKLLRRVSWAENLIASTSTEDEPTDGNTDSQDKASSTAKIKYRSSRQQSLPVELMVGGSWEENPEKLSSPSEQVASGAGTPQSPSDLYQMIAEAPIGVPPAKGILKKKSDSSHNDVEKGVGWSEKNDTVLYVPPSPDDESDIPIGNAPLSESPREIKNLKTAFTYKIVAHEQEREEEEEEGATGPSTSSATPSDERTPASEEPKVISRFKASRMSKQSDSGSST